MKKNTKIVLIIIVVIIGLVILIPTISMAIRDNSYEKEEETEFEKYYHDNSEKVDLEMSKHVETKDYRLENGNILVEVINNNDYAAMGKIYIEFFDKDNNSVTMMDEYIAHIAEGKKVYEEIIVGNELKELYKTYRIKVVLNYNDTRRIYYDNIKFISFDEKSGIIKFKNNTGKKLDSVNWGILYYNDNNQIIDYSTESSYDVKKDETVKDKVYLRNVTYSKIEVVFLDAYNY